jgi:hypothetical protein
MEQEKNDFNVFLTGRKKGRKQPKGLLQKMQSLNKTN